MTDSQEKKEFQQAVLKLPPELKESFMGLRTEMGMNHIDYAEFLISLVKQSQVDGGTDSPVLKQQTEIEHLLSRVSRICSSTLELAVEKQISYKEETDKIVEVARGEVTELKTLLAEQKERLEDLEKERIKNKEIIAGPQDQTESVQALKDAWEIQKKDYIKRVDKLDKEASEAQELKKHVVDLENVLTSRKKTSMALQGKLALASQQHSNNRVAIENCQKQITELKQAADAIKVGHKTLIADLKGEHDKTIKGLKANQLKVVTELNQSRADRLRLNEILQDMDAFKK
jgi:chromosome segregation ATPase